MGPDRFTYPFRYEPSPEVLREAGELICKIDSSAELKEIFGEGKMMGILIVAGKDGCMSRLTAFSGIAGGKNFIGGFVPPIFDILDPEGHFKKEEAKIVEISRLIASASGETGGTSVKGSEASGQSDLQTLKAKRKSMSEELQKWVFRQYKVRNGLGEEKCIWDIFAEYGLVPPGGTGDCAAPKLLDYAFKHGLTPVAMGEFWYERPDSSDGRHGNRKRGQFYPSCSSKCGPLLRWMLRGIEVDNPYGIDGDPIPEVIWEDEYLTAVAKPAGMLCVPGKDGQKSLLERLPQPACSVHRLDMDTSGIVLVAKTLRVQKELQRQFGNREISKTYVALVDMEARPGGNDSPSAGSRSGEMRLQAEVRSQKPHLKAGDRGTIELPIRPDIEDRPRQIVDYLYGKPSVTEYEVLETDESKGLARIRFRPLTGRTHQIRVHASHPSGLGHPITGDLLYGGRFSRRMYLHAESIVFRHPMTGESITLRCPAPF